MNSIYARAARLRAQQGGLIAVDPGVSMRGPLIEHDVVAASNHTLRVAYAGINDMTKKTVVGQGPTPTTLAMAGYGTCPNPDGYSYTMNISYDTQQMYDDSFSLPIAGGPATGDVPSVMDTTPGNSMNFGVTVTKTSKPFKLPYLSDLRSGPGFTKLADYGEDNYTDDQGVVHQGHGTGNKDKIVRKPKYGVLVPGMGGKFQMGQDPPQGLAFYDYTKTDGTNWQTDPTKVPDDAPLVAYLGAGLSFDSQGRIAGSSAGTDTWTLTGTNITPGPPTAAPTLSATGGTGLSIGNYIGALAYGYSDGTISLAGPIASVTTTAGNQALSWSWGAPPTPSSGPSITNVYLLRSVAMTESGTKGAAFYLLATQSASAGSYTDTTSDAALVTTPYFPSPVSISGGSGGGGGGTGGAGGSNDIVVKRVSSFDVTPDSFVAIPWDGEVFKHGITHSTTTSPTRLAVPSSGRYALYVSLDCHVAIATTGTQYLDIDVQIAVNGVRIANDATMVTTNSATAPNFVAKASALLDLSANDYVEVYLYYLSSSFSDITVVSGGSGSPYDSYCYLFGIGGGGGFTGAQTTCAGGQSLSGGTTAIAWNGTNYDAATPFWSSGNPTRFTITTNGKYRLHCSLPLDGISTAQDFNLSIRENGGSTFHTVYQYFAGTSAQHTTIEIDKTLDLTACYLEVTCNATGATVNSSAFMEIEQRG